MLYDCWILRGEIMAAMAKYCNVVGVNQEIINSWINADILKLPIFEPSL